MRPFDSLIHSSLIVETAVRGSPLEFLEFLEAMSERVATSTRSNTDRVLPGACPACCDRTDKPLIELDGKHLLISDFCPLFRRNLV
jgi:hypothetical protein